MSTARGEADQQHVDVERVEPEGARQTRQPQFDAELCARGAALRDRLAQLLEGGIDGNEWVDLVALEPLGGTERARQQRIDLLLGDVEAAEVLVLGLHAAQVGHARADQQVDALELGEEVRR
jgi:hypothetical protein